ncbi:uncharacterized protein [Arachis hypogaea]|uniref:uncharacterized protein isoform X3 n=1 Tax=Arachis hypogaea TaxID=3818 RepID=UPI000DECF059|nr:uncharacterized protein LOC112710530 isoform X4 [Arachis hypogaea]
MLIVMGNKKEKTLRSSISMRDIIYEQEEQIGLGPRQSRLISTVKKSRGLKGGSMVNIIGELEDTASSPSQTPLVPYANDDRPILASPQTNDDDRPATKRKRGPTKCLKTHGLSYEDRLPIRLNKYGQPIGCNRAKLSSHLGTLVRNAHLAPLTYTSWHGLKDNWEDLWEATIGKFDIGERAKGWVFKTLDSSWRTYKSRLKNQYFKKNMPLVYNIKNCPRTVPLEHWKILVQFWSLDMIKAMKNPDRREPSRVNMFFLTHKSRDGKPMSEGTSKIFSELEDAIVSHPEKLESTNQDDILSQVLGKDQPGRVRTYGRGVVASDLWGSRSQVETERLIKEVKENAQTEIQNIQQKMQEEMEIKLQERVEDMKSQMLCGFNVFLNQLQKNLPGVEIPNLFFLSTTLNTKEVEATATANHEVFTAEKEAFCSSLTQEVLDLKLEKMKHDQHKKRSKKKKVVCL